ncbi:ABC transporter permease [Actinocorallia populi]|uniref:ABC transporter permease n=1 Tax=Actinocorallia populi TaxID=2079200 RepID=UPI001E62B46F|nr:ABC transporter permease [Actinocorallia populi]
MQDLFPFGPVLIAVTVFLLLLAAGVATAARLGHGKAILTAGVRAAVQLAAVSFVIALAMERLWGTALFVAGMYAVAAWTSEFRLGRPGWAVVPLLAGTLPVLALLLATGLLPAQGLALIPVAGILIGGTMSATVLSGRRCLDELRARRGEVEAALAIGFTDRQAALEICLPGAAEALLPALDQTRTVGLVTLPGAFVGMLLGGASPQQAAAVQLVVLLGLLAAQSLAITVTVELTARSPLPVP